MSEELESCPVCGALPCDQVELVRDRYKLPATTPAGERNEAVEAAKRVQAFDPAFPNYEEWDDGLTNDAKIIARYLLSCPLIEKVRREALEEAANMAETAAREIKRGHPIGMQDISLDSIAAAIRSLSPTDKQARG